MQFWIFRTRYIVWKLTSLHADSSTKDPVHLSPEIFTKGDFFFLRFSIPSARKRRFPADWNFFFLTVAYRFSCGRTKTEVFEYDNVIHHVAHALYFHRFTAGFSRFRHQPLELLAACESIIFRKRSKTLLFQKNIRLRLEEGLFV